MSWTKGRKHTVLSWTQTQRKGQSDVSDNQRRSMLTQVKAEQLRHRRRLHKIFKGPFWCPVHPRVYINPGGHALNGPAECWVMGHFDKYVVQPKAEICLVERNPGEDAASPHRVSSGFEVTSLLHYINVNVHFHLYFLDQPHGLVNRESHNVSFVAACAYYWKQLN